MKPMNTQNLLVAFLSFLLGCTQVTEMSAQPLSDCHEASLINGKKTVQSLMRTQADAFLQNMPPDLQHKQTLAILKAIDGDNSELMAVRNSRNTQPEYSDNVETSMLHDPILAHQKEINI